MKGRSEEVLQHTLGSEGYAGGVAGCGMRFGGGGTVGGARGRREVGAWLGQIENGGGCGKKRWGVWDQGEGERGGKLG